MSCIYLGLFIVSKAQVHVEYIEVGQSLVVAVLVELYTILHTVVLINLNCLLAFARVLRV